MDINFKTPDLSNISEYSAYYYKYSQNLLTCEAVPSTLVMWEPFYHQKFAILEDSVYVKFETEKNNCFFLLPLCDNLKASTEKLKDYAESRNIPLCFLAEEGKRLEKFISIYKNEYNITEVRDDLEYIYSAQSLKTLSGKKLHSKRNHISAFSRAHNWKYEPLCRENLEEVFKMADKWADEADKTEESVISENQAIKRVLPHMNELKITGGAIRSDGEIVAFCFGTPVNDTVFDVQIEKAHPSFREAYTVINKEFVSRLDEKYIYINREDDMGIEGIRKAKLSYKPEIMLKKYFITPR